MKKIILVLCLLVTLCGCSTNSKPTPTNEIKEEVTETNSDNEKSNIITEEELKSYITKIDISDENWKDIFCVEIDYHEEVNNFGETVIDHENVEAKFTTKPGYMADLTKIGLVLHDNLYGNDMIWEDLSKDPMIEVYYTDVLFLQSKPVDVSNYHDGDVVYLVYEGHGFFTYDTYPFNFDNFTCNKAGGYVYKIDIPEELISDDELRSVDYINSFGTETMILIDRYEEIDMFINGYEPEF